MLIYDNIDQMKALRNVAPGQGLAMLPIKAMGTSK
jgi:hypothetical protein